MRFTQYFMAAAVVGLAAVGAHAQTQTYNASQPLTTTNWGVPLGSITLSFPLFNPAFGTLTSVDFLLSGNVSGNVRIESLDNAPATVNSTLAASVTLTRPDLSTLVVIIPAVNNSDNLSAFDGNTDFGGTSGISHVGVTGGASNSFSTSLPADLAAFTGIGNISLPISAQGTSTATGAGNLITVFQTNADAQVQVVYHYQIRTGAPEPASIALLGLGIAGFVAVRRRRA